jgi:hypothetical protein
MPIPPLDEHGLLPSGVHIATLDEVRGLFGSSTQPRRNLYTGLDSVVLGARATGHFASAVLDGSFVTDEAAPKDVDVVLLANIELFAVFGALNRSPDTQWFLDPEVARERYGVHLYLNDAEEEMVTYFQKLRPEEAFTRNVLPNHLRGVVRVML